MKISVVKPQSTRKPLPPLPFVIRLASHEDWYKLIDEYPMLMKTHTWASQKNIREFNPEYGLYRFFYEDGTITYGPHIGVRTPQWTSMEYP